jgi:hypothetical protein
VAVVTSLTGAAWPTSGTATTGTTGLSSISGFTHVGSTDVPAGSGANGYLKGADNSGTTFRIDGTGVPLQSGTEYCISFWFRAARTASALPANGTPDTCFVVSSGGTKLRINHNIITTASAPGLCPQLDEFLTGGTTDGISSLGGAGYPVISFDRWCRVDIYLTKDAAVGVFALYVNGCLLQRASGLPTSGEITLGQLGAEWQIYGGAVSGLRWEICAPIISYDALPSIRPLHTLNPSTALVTQCHPVGIINQTAGGFWNTAGTATATSTEYATSGLNPARKRVVYTGAASATWSQTLIDQVGTLPFNSGGWATLVLPGLLFRGTSATGQIVVKTTGGAALLTLDVTGGQLKLAAANKIAWTQADRYVVAIHFSSSGSVKVTINDATANNSATNGGSADLGAWTPQAIGVVTISGVLGSDALSQDADGVYVCKEFDAVGVDSLSQDVANALTPSLSIPNHVGATYGQFPESFAIPDAPWRNRPSGQVRRFALFVIGRSGQSRTDLQNNVLANWTHTRGVCVVNIDGGSINDINAIDNSTAARDTIVATLAGQIVSMCTLILASTANRVWLTTMIPRVQGSTYTATELQGINLYNIQLRALARSQQVGGRLRFSDVALAQVGAEAAMFTGGDDTHFNATGDDTYATKMALLEAALSNNTPHRSGIGITAGI